jgi:hypothetical protein
VSIGAVVIHGKPWPGASRPVRPQRAVSSLNRLRAEALATLPLALMPGFYPEHAYDIAGLLTPIIRGSWRLVMRAHYISRVDGGCSGTLATRWN